MDYESAVTWETDSDLLRCNPKFHGQPRYDYVIFNDSGGPAFAQLIYLFVCKAAGQEIPLALVQGMARGVGGRPRIVDKELGLHRVRMVERKHSRFIPLRSVIRGALLCQDPRNRDEYIVVDTVDTDMFLRIRGMFPEHSQ